MTQLTRSEASSAILPGNYNASLKGLIIISLVARCLIASLLELGNDEVYYFTYAVQPDWNHFDHPPLVGLFIKLFTLNLSWVNDLSVRLPGITAATINTWLIAQCGQLIKNERTGFIAAVLYNTSFYTSIISGIFIIPDSVQVLFWLAALRTSIIATHASDHTVQDRYVIFSGLWIGLATMCKVHGIFLWVGLAGYILFFRRQWLLRPALYISLLATILLILPVIYWNFANDFVSWRFHSARVEVTQGINAKLFLTTLLGQIAYQNPVNFCLIALALTGLVRNKHNFLKPDTLGLLLWYSVPIILATSAVSLFRNTLPHWSGPGFLGLTLISAAFIDAQISSGRNKNLYFVLLKSTLILTVAIVLSGVVLINYYPGTMGSQESSSKGKGDFTLDMYGWKKLSNTFAEIRQNDIRLGNMDASSPLVTHKWFPGGHLFYYIAYPNNLPIAGVGNLNDLHKFLWLNARATSVKKGFDGYFITSSDNYADPLKIYEGQFAWIEKPVKIEQTRNGKIARYWYIFRLRQSRTTLKSIK